MILVHENATPEQRAEAQRAIGTRPPPTAEEFARAVAAAAAELVRKAEAVKGTSK